MSQESGIPTFRDALTGLWSQFRPEELATESAFRKNPERVFNWYLDRLRMIQSSEPNAGHSALVVMERFFDTLTVVTQNVDGLHRRAGSANISELHGSLQKFRCADCAAPVSEVDLANAIMAGGPELVPPLPCVSCGGYARPGVVWFGESLPAEEMSRSWSAARGCDLMLVVGTSAQVYPAAELPHLALEAGARVIEVNPTGTPLSDLCAGVIRDSAANCLERFAQGLSTQGI
jgi:NAD-dependent deacetylase